MAEGKILEIKQLPCDIEFVSDYTLLLRSIVNLLKNALEASKSNNLIRVYCIGGKDEITFNVFNNKVIPQNVQVQLFQRSFSTKQKKEEGWDFTALN